MIARHAIHRRQPYPKPAQDIAIACWSANAASLASTLEYRRRLWDIADRFSQDDETQRSPSAFATTGLGISRVRRIQRLIGPFIGRVSWPKMLLLIVKSGIVPFDDQ